jgi:hypothetical protein
MRESPRPSILLSYLVTRPLEGNYNTYVGEKSGMRDIDPSDWDRWCEYILYKGLKRTGYARVSRGTITDTEVQVSSPLRRRITSSDLTSFRLGNSSSAKPQRRQTKRYQRTKFEKASDSQRCSRGKAFGAIDIMSSTSLDTLHR